MMLWEIITNLMGACILVRYVRGYLPPRWKERTERIGSVTAVGLYFGLVTMMNYLFHFEGYWGLLIYGLAAMGIAAALVKVPLWSYVSIGITWSGITLCSSLFASAVLKLCEGGELQELLVFGNPQKLVALITNLLVKVVISYIAVHTRKNNVQSSLDHIIYCLLFLSISGIAMSIFQYENVMESRWKNDNFLVIMAMVLVLLLLVMMYFSMRIGMLMKRQEEERLLGVAGNLQSAELMLTADKLTELRQFQHDSEKAIRTLRELLDTGNLTEAEEFLAQYAKLSEQVRTGFFSTGIPVVDAVVNTRFMEMQESDIEFSCVIQARVSEKLIYEVGIILANLLDNAIEAEQKEQGKREIRLNITQKGQYLCIRVENRISESVIAQNRFLETTKPDKERHGFGMKSIDFHCKRCGGFHGVLEENGFFIYEVFLKDKAEIQKV